MFHKIKILIGAAILVAALIFDAAELPLFVIAYIILGYDVIIRAARNTARGKMLDENFLMSIATLGAFAIGEYPEGVAVMLFYQIGELFQRMAIVRSRKSISELMNIQPEYANLEIDGEIKKVDPYDVKVNDNIVIKPGEKVPLDGVVTIGNSTMDTSALTGESVPRVVSHGDQVISGSVNISGLLKVTVTKEYSESTVSRILELVEDASSRKSSQERFITRFARYYTPFVVIMAVMIAVIPPLLTGDEFSGWIYRALVFLVVSCPCALVISVPLSFFGGIGGASRRGILIKGGNFIEALADVDTVVFDKTGTLTKGTFSVYDVCAMNADNKDMLKFAAYAEAFSDHPIAQSVRKAYGGEIDHSIITDVTEIHGQGVKANVSGRSVMVGSSRLVHIPEDVSVNVTDTVTHISIDGNYQGYLLIADEIKDDSYIVSNELRKEGVKRVVMLTGDLREVGEKVAKELGINEVYTEMLPEDKVSMTERIMRTSKKLAFVGDGVNDAPALARADVGIAMGALGSDAAIEAADVVVMTDEPSKVPEAIRISKRTMNIAKQNILLALSIKAAVMALGIAGIATMWEAVFADVGVSVLAILNAMRALKVAGDTKHKIPNRRPIANELITGR